MPNEKRITFNRHTKDFDAYLDDEYVGSFGSYHEAEVELDDLVLNLITQHYRDAQYTVRKAQRAEENDNGVD